MLFTTADLVTGFLAGLVVCFATTLVEHFGGVIGGVISTLPHVAVFGSIAFYIKEQDDNVGLFHYGTLSMPMGMLAIALLILTFHTLSQTTRIPFLKNLKSIHRLMTLTFLSLCCYAASTGFLLLVFSQISQNVRGLWLLSIGCFICHFLVASCTLRTFTPSPKADSPSSLKGLVLRGTSTTILFLLATTAAASEPALAGILVNFPLVTIVTVTSLWVTHGEVIAIGVLTPMSFGMLSPSLYALLATSFVPLLDRWGFAVAWVVAVCLATLPITLFLRRVHEKRRGQQEEGEELEQVCTS